MKSSGEERSTRGEVRLGVDPLEQRSTVSNARRTTLFVVVVLPVVVIGVLLLNGALINVILAVALNGRLAFRGGVLEGAGADFSLERSRLAHGGSSLAQMLGEGAALGHGVGLEGAAVVLLGGSAECEHGLPLLGVVGLCGQRLGDEAGRLLEDGGGVQVSARANRGGDVARLKTTDDAVLAHVGRGAGLGADYRAHDVAADAGGDGRC